MMVNTHPDEGDLLSYVEGELESARSLQVSEHIDGCPICADAVRHLEAGREALRSAPLLEFPGARRDQLIRALPAREPTRRWFASPGRLVAIVAPVAAVAAAVAVIVANVDQGGDREAGRDQSARATPEAAQSDEAGGGAGEAESAAEPAGPIAAVKGPPQEVAQLLRRQGYDVRVAGKTVILRDADPVAVSRALAGRPRGAVQVVIE